MQRRKKDGVERVTLQWKRNEHADYKNLEHNKELLKSIIGLRYMVMAKGYIEHIEYPPKEHDVRMSVQNERVLDPGCGCDKLPPEK
jgi:hypothetical protein